MLFMYGIDGIFHVHTITTNGFAACHVHTITTHRYAACHVHTITTNRFAACHVHTITTHRFAACHVHTITTHRFAACHVHTITTHRFAALLDSLATNDSYRLYLVRHVTFCFDLCDPILITWVQTQHWLNTDLMTLSSKENRGMYENKHHGNKYVLFLC